MTREEQINLYLKERNIPITSLEANSIIEGIKWADEHPNLYNMKLWIARNKTGELIINRKCPYYHKHLESWCGGETIGYFDNYMFPGVTFENSPQEVELKLN